METILIHRIVRGAPGITARQTLFHAIGSVHRTVCGEFHRHRSGLAQMKGKRLIEIETSTPAPALLSSRHSRECYDLGLGSGTNAAAQTR